MRAQFAATLRSFVLLATGAGAVPLAAPAQCSNPWLAGSSTPGVLGASRHINAACAWDRDGAGPMPPAAVVGGDFTIAGSVYANAIAVFDPGTGTWSALGQGVAGQVRALLPMTNGDLVVAGTFAMAGGVAATNIVRFDGTSWWPLGTGIAGTVMSLAQLPNGDLIAGGYFTSAGGVAADNIARWNGATWAALGAGIGGGDVRALAVLPNGDLIAGGFYSSAGGAAAANIARWDGASWTPLGLGLDSAVQALLVRSNGDLIAGGYFDYSGSSAVSPWMPGVARWNGTSWSALGSGVLGSAWSLAELANGNLVVGCFQSQDSILQWNGATWLTMDAAGDDPGTVRALTLLPNGDLVAGGNFFRLGGIGAGSVARWNGSWSAMGQGLTSPVAELVELGDGTIVGFGGFAVGSSRGLGVFDGAAWVPFPVALDGVTGIEPLPNGDLLAVGTFPGPGGGNNLAQWNGTSWTTYAPGLVGTGLNGQVTGIAVLPNGDVAACGTFPQRLAVWNGTAWISLGALTLLSGSPEVRHLAVTPNGDLVVAGFFSGIGGVAANNIARWNGSVWAPLGPGLTLPLFSGFVSTLAALPNGDVVVGGAFTIAGAFSATIARFDGTAWSPFGSGLNSFPDSVVGLPDGDVVAGGNFASAGGVTTNYIARWNGASWSAFGTGLDSSVYALAVRANGNLAVGGNFQTANGTLSPYFAEITTTCPASAVVSGPGCNGSGGPNVLTATTLPWLGATFRAQATGLPPSSFALIANGLTPIALPLSALFPQGLPGCNAWVLADLIDVALPTAGAVTTEVPLPNIASLVGAAFQQQVLPFVFDASGNLIELTSTNALTITLGAF